MNHNSTATPATWRQLQQFRWGLIFTGMLTAMVGLSMHSAQSDGRALLVLLILHIVSNVAISHWPWGRQAPLRLVSILLIIDTLLLLGILLVSGGANNGFVALLLLPVAVSAMLLPSRFAYAFAALAIASYALLLESSNTDVSPSIHQHHMSHPMHQEMQKDTLATDNHHSAQQMQQHLWQMGWAFAVSAGLIAWFISRQARQIRLQAAQLNQWQQQQLQQEQLLAIATYGANAAHDLATPLQHLTLLADELAEDKPQDERYHELMQQVQRCQHIVQGLRQQAQSIRQGQRSQDAWLCTEQVLQLWLVSRPDISIAIQRQRDDSQCQISDAMAWTSALFQILDNAADASLACAEPRLEVKIQLHAATLQLQIRDYGPGLSAQQLAELGKVPQHSDDGLGLGQWLAQGSIQRLGAQLNRRNHTDGGVITTVELKHNITSV